MNKPISIAINETRISLANVLNTSNLPPCILEMIVKELYDEARHISSVQLKQDEENYAKTLIYNENTNNEQENEQQTTTEPSKI